MTYCYTAHLTVSGVYFLLFRVCQSNGQWAGKIPECIEIFCGLLTDIPNAALDITTTKVNARHSPVNIFLKKTIIQAFILSYDKYMN